MFDYDDKPEPERYVLLVSALLALVLGTWTGLVRLGWTLPLFGHPELTLQHGPLMIAGFLGVLIPLERAVAMETRWAGLIPLLSALGMVCLLLPGVSSTPGIVLITGASLGYTGLFLYFLWLSPELHAVVMLGGAAFWLAGNLLWIFGRGLPEVVFFLFIPRSASDGRNRTRQSSIDYFKITCEKPLCIFFSL